MKAKSFEGLSISSQLSEFNTTKIDYYPDKLSHQLFEEQVALSPDQVAIVCENQQLTYAELNIRANQLAHHLQALGVGTEVLVGIYLERSLEVVIAILGIFKAGAAYVPLDPAYPKERLAFMLEETQVGVILTQSQLVEGLPQPDLRTVCFDTDWELISRHNEDTPISQVTKQNLAYVMYTSGSTGKPKGVQITHANVWHYCQSISQILQVNSEDVYFHTASFSFSSSVRQLLLPLSQGAKIVIATNEQIKNPLRLFELIQQKGITVFDTVASVWRYGLQSIENLEQTDRDLLLSSKLRLSVFSGGLLPCQLLKKVRSQLKNPPHIVNIYGQTETIGVTAYPIPAEFDQEQGYVPVGYALDHIHQLCLLDENLQQPVAVGEVGELHVAGTSLTRGYLNRPDLTAQKLIVNPLDQLASPLLKTGDIARYLPDGTLEVLGRVDFQVKLRGMRVELGEIESLLEKHPSIKETVLSAVDDKHGDKRLVAYIVCHSSAQQIPQSELTRELRGFLEDQLPDYMVPSTFVVLQALPLTPNGKLDRLSLPAPDQVNFEQNREFVNPRSDLEILLKDIWEKVLGVEDISVKDNFFELGGHSLLAVQILAHVEKISGKNLPLATLLQAPTIETLANIVREQGVSAPWSSLVPIQPTDSKTHLFCVHGIFGNVLNFMDLASALGQDQSVYGLQAKGIDGKQTPLYRIEDIAAHCIQEIRSIQSEGPYFLAGYSFGGTVAFEMAQQLQKQGEKVALLALFDSSSVSSCQKLNFRKQLSAHFNNFSRFGLKYLLKKIKKKIKQANNSSNNNLSLALDKINENQELSSTNFSPSLFVCDINKEAASNYVPQVYPGKAILFRVSKPQETEDWYCDPQLGWGGLVTGGLEIHEVPGDHLSMLEKPHVQVLAEKLRLCLDREKANIFQGTYLRH